MERVLQVLEGVEGIAREVALESGVLEIGRTGTSLAFPDDADMAERQARVLIDGENIRIEDSGEGSGVWLRIDGGEGRLLRPGDQLWVGSQILVVRRQEGSWQIRHHGPDGRLRDTHPVSDQGLFIGRASDLVLDLADSRLSRRHAQLVVEGDRLRLYDRGAHNGTYLRLTASEGLSAGDEFRVSTQRFRVAERMSSDSTEAAAGDAAEPSGASQAPIEDTRPSRGLAARLRRLGSAAPRGADEGRENGVSGPGSPAARQAARADEQPVSTDGSSVLDVDEGADATGRILVVLDSEAGSVSIEASDGQTILEAVREAGLARGEPVDWECGDGRCGVCVLGVVEGAGRMDPPDPATEEMKTIQITEQVVPDPNLYRLACRARVRGTVRLRKLTS